MNEEAKAEQAILEKTDKKLDEIIDFIFSKSQENIVRKGAMNSGHLLHSGNVQRAFLNKTITYSAPYATYVEFGTEPHMPPVEPLEQWGKRKFGKSGLGYPVAMKIKKQGTPPVRYLSRARRKVLGV